MKKSLFLLVMLIFILTLSSCENNISLETPSAAEQKQIIVQNDPSETETENTPSYNSVTSNAILSDAEENQQNNEGINKTMELKIEDVIVSVEWEDNESVTALKELCTNRPLIIQMSMYGGFEQVGSIGTDLPENDVKTTTQAGDIVLYSGNQIVLFYGSNSWTYTRLGRITGQALNDISRLLGNGNVTITISTD